MDARRRLLEGQHADLDRGLDYHRDHHNACGVVRRVAGFLLHLLALHRTRVREAMIASDVSVGVPSSVPNIDDMHRARCFSLIQQQENLVVAQPGRERPYPPATCAAHQHTALRTLTVADLYGFETE